MKFFCHNHFFCAASEVWRGLLFSVFFSLVLTSCRSLSDSVIEKPVYIHDTVRLQSVQKDSVYVHDSVYMYLVGDTVKVTKTVTKLVTKIKHDTIREVQEVPIEVVKTEVVTIEKPLRWYQKALNFLGALVVVFGCGFILSWIVNRKDG